MISSIQHDENNALVHISIPICILETNISFDQIKVLHNIHIIT